MKRILLGIIATIAISASSSAIAANDCKVFVSYESASSPEPVQLDCGADTRNMKECSKACLKVAFSKCPDPNTEFQGSANFNSPQVGFELSTISGDCAKAPKSAQKSTQQSS